MRTCNTTKSHYGNNSSFVSRFIPLNLPTRIVDTTRRTPYIGRPVMTGNPLKAKYYHSLRKCCKCETKRPPVDRCSRRRSVPFFMEQNTVCERFAEPDCQRQPSAATCENPDCPFKKNDLNLDSYCSHQVHTTRCGLTCGDGSQTYSVLKVQSREATSKTYWGDSLKPGGRLSSTKYTRSKTAQLDNGAELVTMNLTPHFDDVLDDDAIEIA